MVQPNPVANFVGQCTTFVEWGKNAGREGPVVDHNSIILGKAFIIGWEGGIAKETFRGFVIEPVRAIIARSDTAKLKLVTHATYPTV